MNEKQREAALRLADALAYEIATIESLYQAAALLRELAAEPVQEPVAEVIASDDINGFRFRDIDGRMKWLRVGDKLYSAPKQRKTLTVKQINAMPEAGGWWPYSLNDRIMRLIRAVERAHGIGEAQ